MTMHPVLAQLSASLSPHKLSILGHCAAEPDDGVGAGTLVLIGPDEPAFWSVFTSSPEYRDTAADPLDRWSKRVLTSVATQLDATALFPFGGAPYLPFYTWALRTGRFWPSPIGFLVHESAGLFVSFRGALLVLGTIAAERGLKPCDTCTLKPCQSACPVDAFADGYDVAACKAHLTSVAGNTCMTTGCQARSACPIGQNRRLPAQAAFHMKAFL